MKIDSATAARQILDILPPVMQTLAAELRSTGNLLTPSHFGVMVMLAYESHNLSELAEYQAVSLPTMSGTIRRLVERGWVKRSRVAHDRRIVLLELTPLGREKLEQIRRQAEERLIALMESVTESDREALAMGLVVLHRIFVQGEMLQASTPRPGQATNFT